MQDAISQLRPACRFKRSKDAARTSMAALLAEPFDASSCNKRNIRPLGTLPTGSCRSSSIGFSSLQRSMSSRVQANAPKPCAASLSRQVFIVAPLHVPNPRTPIMHKEKQADAKKRLHITKGYWD